MSYRYHVAFKSGAVAALIGFSASICSAAPLYTYKGKTVDEKDLSPAAKQAVYQLELEKFQQLQGIIDNALLDAYFTEQAAATKKSKEDVEVAELQAGEPTEAEIKKFYEQNKKQIPPNLNYDQIKPELKRYVSQSKSAEKRKELLAKVKKSGKFAFTAQPPEAPVVTINSDGFPSTGKAGAKVKIVEFADYQCPHCRAASSGLADLMKAYGNKVEMVFIDFPINPSGISRVVAEGAYCANKGGKYWEYHHMAFAEQPTLTKDSPVGFAKKLGLAEEDFKKCLASADAKAFVSRGHSVGVDVGVDGTPAIFINGKRTFFQSFELAALKKVIDAQL